MAFVSRSPRRLGELNPSTPAHVGPGAYASASPPSTSSGHLSYAPFSTSAERGIETLSAAESFAAATPGPGEYNAKIMGKSLSHPLQTVFSSTVPRFGSGIHSFTGQGSTPEALGPGSYVGVDMKGWHKGGRASTAVGRSRAQTAGPGGVDRRHSSPGGGTGSFTWVRTPLPPSIPTPAQSFGYEENEFGELVLQTPSDPVGHTGRPEDMAGPGEYVVDSAWPLLSSTRKVKGFAAWSKSRSKRGTHAYGPKTDGPAPGQYAPAWGNEGADDGRAASPSRSVGGGTSRSRPRSRPSPSFASTVSRLRADAPGSLIERGGKRDAVPGPGSYSHAFPSAFDRATKQYVPASLQFFGTKSQRFLPEGKARAILPQSPTPGPGSYQIPSSIRVRSNSSPVRSPSKDLDPSSPLSPQHAFFTSYKRFTSLPNESVPGPGAYVSLPNTSLELSRKIFGRNTSFGTTEERFHHVTADTLKPGVGKAATEVGPGSYETTNTPTRQTRKPLSVFVSTSKRFGGGSAKHETEEKTASSSAVSLSGRHSSPSPTRESRPARGLGSEPSRGSSVHARPSSSFASHASRFNDLPFRKKAVETCAVGPGSYEANPTNIYRAAPAVSSSFKAPSRARQRIGPKPESVPGPGSYTADVTSPESSSFIKRSFNITIDGNA